MTAIQGKRRLSRLLVDVMMDVRFD